MDANHLILIMAGAIGSSVLAALVDILKGSAKKHMEVLRQNTEAIIKLETKVEFLIKHLDEIGEVRRDLDKLGAKLRGNA